MHLGTHQVMQGTFSRDALTKALKYEGISDSRIEEIHKLVGDVPDMVHEVSLLKILGIFARQKEEQTLNVLQ